MSSILLDTSILVRLADAGDPDNPVAAAAVLELSRRQDELVIVPQSIYEFWTVATRPAGVRGLGYPPAQTRTVVDGFTGMFSLLDESATLYEDWLELVTKHGVSGKEAHDARLVAHMIAKSIPSILTFNVTDFLRFPQIAAVHPKAV